MAEVEKAPRPPPVLAEIPARVQALDNPLPRAPEAELVQADQAAPANELAQPVEVLVLLCLFVSGSSYVSCSMPLFLAHSCAHAQNEVLSTFDSTGCRLSLVEQFCGP